MPFNGAGSFTSLGAPTFPAVSGDFILASYFNATMNDVFSGLSSVLPRDGQAAMAANLPMGGFKVTNVGAGAVAGDALMYGQAAAVLAGLTVNTTFAMTGTMTAAAGTVNLTGATSVTVPLQAVADDSDKAASTAYVWDFFATMPSGTLPSMVGKSLYNLRVNAGETGVEWALVTPAITRDARTGNTILGVADQGHLIDVTSGTFSQTFAAAATLGSGWFVWYKNSGTGTVTLDPDAGELINGATTYIVPSLHTVLLQCTGTAFTVIAALPNNIRRLPIFSATAIASKAVSNLETMENSLPLTGIGSVAIYNIIYGNSLFLAAAGSPGGAQANIASSPDGVIYTLRAMPSSAAWVLGTNGTNKFVACVPGATTIAKSTDGTTWVAGTALGANAATTHAFPVFVGDRVLINSVTASTAYWSDDNGASWTAATLPAAAGSMRFFSVGGLFWYWNATTVAYTSATGATGAWTVRALPVTPNNVFQAPDGSLWMSANSGTVWYRTTDGINWTAQAANLIYGVGVNSMALMPIGTGYAHFSTTLGVAWSYHAGVPVLRLPGAALPALTYRSGAQNTAGTIFVLPSGAATGAVIYIEPDATTASTAVFSN